MGVDYFLVCMSCKNGIQLGKSIHVKYRGMPEKTYGFSLMGTQKEGIWVPDVRCCSSLQHFLMLHRAHELRVLSEHVEKYAKHSTVPYSFPMLDFDENDGEHSRYNFFSTSPSKPDPAKEADELPEDLIAKLKQF